GPAPPRSNGTSRYRSRDSPPGSTPPVYRASASRLGSHRGILFPGHAGVAAQGRYTQEVEVFLHVGFTRPPLKKGSITVLSEFGSQRGREGQLAERLKQFLLRPVHEASSAIVNHFGQRPQIPYDNRCLAREGFNIDHAKCLIRDGRHDRGQGVVIERSEPLLRLGSQEANP